MGGLLASFLFVACEQDGGTGCLRDVVNPCLPSLSRLIPLLADWEPDGAAFRAAWASRTIGNPRFPS